MPRLHAIATILSLLSAIFFSSSYAAQQCLVVGDSLTKEYEVEFPILYRDNPQSWDSRNWIEILHARRNDWFDQGNFSSYADPRIRGREHNWAFPGAKTAEIRERLESTAFFDQFWQAELEGQVQSAVERIAVFAGGNDVDSYYGTIYGGGSPTTHITQTGNNIKVIVNYFITLKPSLQFVLVSVPHVGCAPLVQNEFPTDPVKTARVTAALDTLNADLAAYAQSKNIGFAAGVYERTKAMITTPLRIGGVDLFPQADADARPRYAFSGDGFHPNTGPQAMIAQEIVNAFRAKYPSPDITPLGDTEILENVLGLDRHLPFTEFMAATSVPANQRGFSNDPEADSAANLLEFALEGLDPSVSDTHLLPTPVRVNISGQDYLTLTYRPSARATGYATITPGKSTNLTGWTQLDASDIFNNPDGTITARIPITSAADFLRLSVSTP